MNNGSQRVFREEKQGKAANCMPFRKTKTIKTFDSFELNFLMIRYYFVGAAMKILISIA